MNYTEKKENNILSANLTHSKKAWTNSHKGIVLYVNLKLNENKF